MRGERSETVNIDIVQPLFKKVNEFTVNEIRSCFTELGINRDK